MFVANVSSCLNLRKCRYHQYPCTGAMLDVDSGIKGISSVLTGAGQTLKSKTPVYMKSGC